MKDTGIDKASLKEIETDSPIFKGFQSIRKLFWKYLNLLGVPFNDPCCPTASTATGGSGYLVYTANLAQASTNPPIVTLGVNQLGGTVVWTYEDVGVYRGTLEGAFPEGTVIILGSSAGLSQASRSNADSILIETFLPNFTPSDDIIANVGIWVIVPS